MDLNDIKDIIQKEGGKIVIVENDKPRLIIMSYEEYRGRRATQDRSSPPDSQPLPVTASPSSPPLRAERQDSRMNRYSSGVSEGGQSAGLTIDDLPL